MQSKAERALELIEKGLTSEMVAGRMGTTITNVNRLIYAARQKRQVTAALKLEVAND